MEIAEIQHRLTARFAEIQAFNERGWHVRRVGRRYFQRGVHTLDSDELDQMVDDYTQRLGELQDLQSDDRGAVLILGDSIESLESELHSARISLQ
jgi:hypothetical protein